MNSTAKRTTVAVGSALLAMGMTGTAIAGALPGVDAASAPDGQLAAVAVEGNQQDVVEVEQVLGTFSFTQGVNATASQMAKLFGKAPAFLCGGQTAGSLSAAAETAITVDGDVEQSFTATLEELSKQGQVRLVMGCTCAGTPIGGRTTTNAFVEGVRISYIAHLANPAETVNTIVFTCEDGYQIALPWTYVKQRISVLVFSVCDEPIANSMGGFNQLWLGSTAANYFGRNVVRITFETRETPPAIPGTPEAGDRYDNMPSLSILDGSVR